MENWKRNLWLLWIGCFFTSSSYSMVVPFLPLFLLQIGVHHHTEVWSGVLFSAAFLAGAVVSPIWGALSDKYGRKPMIIRAGFSLFFVYTLTAFVTNPYELLILRILQGLLSGFIPAAITLVSSNTPNNKVGYALAMMSTATASGNILGPLLGGGLAELLSNRLAFFSAGVLVLLSTLLVVFWVTEKSFQPSVLRASVVDDMRQSARNRPFMIILFLTVSTTFSLMTIEPVLPLYIVHLMHSNENTSLLTGIIFSLPGVASIIFAPYWGKLADKIGFRPVLVIGLLGGGLGSIAQMPFHDIWGFSIARFIFGIFFCAVFPAINGLVVQTTPKDFRGRAFGLNQTANQVGSMLGPMVGGVIGGIFAINSVFFVTGVLLLAVTGLAYWSKGRNTTIKQGTDHEHKKMAD
ncbi:MFS transporter [Camelliibacillus cellulosilyticus]|uniref:MFS transporter n=1 Tax=Camelliibacillus cellulosilyticus TaxID=2174486 RepID=A0ABV9GQ29_9BACL